MLSVAKHLSSGRMHSIEILRYAQNKNRGYCGKIEFLFLNQ